jgi:hypothetical protein
MFDLTGVKFAGIRGMKVMRLRKFDDGRGRTRNERTGGRRREWKVVGV